MIAALLLALREGLEVALILGIVLSALRRAVPNDITPVRVVWLGAGLAALVSLAVGLALHTLGIAFEGAGEAVFEGMAMLLAAGVLTWMIFWMARQGRAVQAGLQRGVHLAMADGSRWALFSLAFLAVLREGIELALFLTAVAFTVTTGTSLLLGAALGLGGATLAGLLLFATSQRLNVRTFFRVTGVLLIVVAGGLVAHGVHELNEVGWVPPVIEHVWNVNRLLDEGSPVGQILATLVGYNGDPSLSEVVAYTGYWLAVSLALVWPRLQALRRPVLLREGNR